LTQSIALAKSINIFVLHTELLVSSCFSIILFKLLIASLLECPLVLAQCLHQLVFAHLFVNVSRPAESEVTFSIFESSCHLVLY